MQHTARLLVLLTVWWVAHTASAAELSNAEEIDAFLDRAVAETRRHDARRVPELGRHFNTEFWIDPASGIGAVLLMQYLPFYDEAAIDTLVAFEELVYRRLR